MPPKEKPVVSSQYVVWVVAIIKDMEDMQQLAMVDQQAQMQEMKLLREAIAGCLPTVCVDIDDGVPYCQNIPETSPVSSTATSLIRVYDLEGLQGVEGTMG